MIISAVNTNRISAPVAFKGGETDRNIWAMFVQRQNDVLKIGGIQEGTTISAKSACTADEALEVVRQFAIENDLAPVREVIKEVPASTPAVSPTPIAEVAADTTSVAKTAAATATQASWKTYGKKYGIPAAIALVAAIAAFFIGKAAESKRQEKLDGEDSTPTSYKQPQPVLQEAAKPADTNLENFFSAPQEAAKT